MPELQDTTEFILNRYYNVESRVFEFGDIPENKSDSSDKGRSYYFELFCEPDNGIAQT